MKKLYPFIFLLSFLIDAKAQQTIQLFAEDFNTGTSANFQLNGASGLGSNIGPNQWVINSQYNGINGYPITTSESNTVSGTIAGAPFSPYLHIYDSGANGSPNASWDPNNASDRAAAITPGICTQGLINVTMTFFYLCEGDANAYGQVYYSINGGTVWMPVGPAMYANQTQWKYQILTDPAFDNQPDLRFAFRWINQSTGTTPTMSFAIDDIFVVGTYDDISNPCTITVTNVTPNPVCQGSYLFIFFSFSYPLCTGQYEIQLSAPNGSWASPTNMGVFTLGTGTMNSAIAIQIPYSQQPGTCYQVVINRLAPAPAISGVASACFTVQVCPNTITTLQPVVTFGPDTLCVHSAIDVPFYSTGSFAPTNNYIAQLSDSAGNFTSPQLIGTFPSSNTFDPNLGSPPGTVSGLVSNTPDGCNYFIRVISTSPSVIPPPPNYFGPFCIHHCDEETNQTQDISVCISDYIGVDTAIDVNVHMYNNLSSYPQPNQFQAQILSSMTYQIINTGGLGSVTASNDTTLILNIPGLIPLIQNITGAPGYGLYYLRVVATNSTTPNNALGTIVRLTIGAPDSLPGIIIPNDTMICAGDLLYLYNAPHNFDSQYQWYSPSLNNGQPFFWDYYPLIVQFNTNSTPGTYWFTVREYNYGCFGPWSDTVYITLQATPNVYISGPTTVCMGDTVHYQVPFQIQTYYQWAASYGYIVDTANNEILITFDSVGIAHLSIFALNGCGSNSGIKNINVIAPPNITPSVTDTTICGGDPVYLSVSGNATSYYWNDGVSNFSTATSVTVHPTTTTQYVVVGSNPQGCKDRDTVMVNVNPGVDPGLVIQNIMCHGDHNGGLAYNITGGTGTLNISWTPPVGPSPLTNLGPGSYTLHVTDAIGCSFDTVITVSEPPGIIISTVVTKPTTYGASDASAIATASGGVPPYTYMWNTNPIDNDSALINVPAGDYILTVTDANGCVDTVHVHIPELDAMIQVPNAFSPNADGSNDQFYPFTFNLISYHLRIYDRWGELIFETYDINDHWDGTYQGVDQNIGVYVWVINAVDANGKDIVKSGNVTLLR